MGIRKSPGKFDGTDSIEMKALLSPSKPKGGGLEAPPITSDCERRGTSQSQRENLTSSPLKKKLSAAFEPRIRKQANQEAFGGVVVVDRPLVSRRRAIASTGI